MKRKSFWNKFRLIGVKGLNYYTADPYLDCYINLECPGCREIIHYGSETCPKCGVKLDPDHPEVKSARRWDLFE